MTPIAATLPVTLLTGFLGSGKTTVLNHLLRSHPLTAVVMNEFGAVGLDHQLVEGHRGPMALLSGGCLCCAVQGTLAPTLKNLHLGRSDGRLPAFERLIIETTGIANPAPILDTLRHDRWLAARYALDGIVTTVDGVFGPAQLDRYPEALRQIAVADRLLITKPDLADAAALQNLHRRLDFLNPGAERLTVTQGVVDAARILDQHAWRPADRHPDVLGWLGTPRYAPMAAQPGGLNRKPSPAPGHADIRSFSLRFDTPLVWWGLRAALDLLMDLRGPQLLRMKAIVHVLGRDLPVVLHGTQHILHAPCELPAWPDDDRGSRFVFITDGLEELEIKKLLEDFSRALRPCSLDELRRRVTARLLPQPYIPDKLSEP